MVARVVPLARSLFALASASLAVFCLAYGDFTPEGQPLPAWIPAPHAWVYGIALIVLAASAGLCFARTAAPSVLVIGAYEAIWVAVAVPQMVSQPLGVDAWYPLCEGLTPLAGACVLWVLLRSPLQGSLLWSGGAVRLARALFGLTCVFYGWSHFVYAAYTASLVPAWLPGRLAFAYLTGVGHIAAGVAIIIGILPGLAASLEAIMMSLFGLLVWAPTFFEQPPPAWATPPKNRWSELVVTVALAASAWVIATSYDKFVGQSANARGLR